MPKTSEQPLKVDCNYDISSEIVVANYLPTYDPMRLRCLICHSEVFIDDKRAHLEDHERDARTLGNIERTLEALRTGKADKARGGE